MYLRRAGLGEPTDVDLLCRPVELADLQNDGPEEAAQGLRDAWMLGTGTPGHLRALQNHGVLVGFRPGSRVGFSDVSPVSALIRG